jgi:hypothetical protein
MPLPVSLIRFHRIGFEQAPARSTSTRTGTRGEGNGMDDLLSMSPAAAEARLKRCQHEHADELNDSSHYLHAEAVDRQDLLARLAYGSALHSHGPSASTIPHAGASIPEPLGVGVTERGPEIVTELDLIKYDEQNRDAALDSTHPDHARVIRERDRLYRIVYGS